jgi:hypothetical protein
VADIPPCRTAVGLSFAGCALFAADVGRVPELAVIGMLLCIVAAMLYCSELVIREVRAANRPADQAWLDGFEAGYDRGWRDHDEGESGATVVPLTPARVRRRERADAVD